MSVRKTDLYNILPMSIKDLRDVYNLEIESYDYPWTKEILRDCILYKYDSFSLFFNDCLVGYIIARISNPETHILNLTVKSDFRGKGLGTSLVELIINDSKIRGSEEIFLEVRVSNIEAIALYRKLNFERIGIRKNYYESSTGREDAYVYKLRL